MTTQPTLARQRIMDAREMLSQVFVILDDLGPLLDEPERSAALLLRADIADASRRLTNMMAFLRAAS